ncbi:hypothetical protein [Gottfriedia luciferensis]|uniref:hypothetical protein n=1 Tax=Gottfriedia luciferensis TaxID=178774 RepID=UPI001ABF4BD5|nr:hypothetical protein [Gottfriedia luciferensis]
MLKEEKIIKLIFQGDKLIEVLIELYEEAPEDEDMVMLKIKLEQKERRYIGDNFFEALEKLRQDLEEENIQIICNGSALNVYPYPMALSMGSGRLAYKLSFGKQALLKDLVDIFDCDNTLNFVSILEQRNFYNDWLNSLKSHRN